MQFLETAILKPLKVFNFLVNFSLCFRRRNKNGRRKSKQATVYVDFEVLKEILEIVKHSHPREIILLLRGRSKKNEIHVTDYLVPPFAIGGRWFSHFNPYFSPMDFSIVGTAHSHPSEY